MLSLALMGLLGMPVACGEYKGMGCRGRTSSHLAAQMLGGEAITLKPGDLLGALRDAALPRVGAWTNSAALLGCSLALGKKPGNEILT